MGGSLEANKTQEICIFQSNKHFVFYCFFSSSFQIKAVVNINGISIMPDKEAKLYTKSPKGDKWYVFPIRQ